MYKVYDCSVAEVSEQAFLLLRLACIFLSTLVMLLRLEKFIKKEKGVISMKYLCFKYVPIYLLILCIGWAMPSVAGITGLTFFTDRTQCDASCPGLPVEDFETNNCAANAAVELPDPLNSSSNDACFMPGQILPGIEFTSPGMDAPGSELVFIGSNFFGVPSDVVVANVNQEPYFITFPGNVVDTACMDIVSVAGSTNTCDIDIYGTSGFLGSINVPCTPGGNFFGVQSDTDITRIEIFDTTAGIRSGLEGADNIAFGLCGAGEGCSAGYWRNRARKDNSSEFEGCPTISPFVTMETLFGCDLDSCLPDGTEFAQARDILFPGFKTNSKRCDRKAGAAAQLLRQGTAARLNACNLDVNYPLSAAAIDTIICDLLTSIDGGGSSKADILAASSQLDDNNNQECTVDP